MFRPVLQASKTHPKSFFDIRQENLGPQKHLSVVGPLSKKSIIPRFSVRDFMMPGGQSHTLIKGVNRHFSLFQTQC